MAKRTSRQKAFTLVELLVVIVIIAVLAAALLGKYSQVREDGWSTQCKANLRNLYQAALNYATDNATATTGGPYPHAGPWEDDSYHEIRGWVDWTPRNTAFDVTNLWTHIDTSYTPDAWYAGSAQIGQVNMPVWWGSDGVKSIQFGSIWEYTGHDMNAYICPKFRYLARKNYALNAVRGYVMNAFFGCMNSAFVPGNNQVTKTLANLIDANGNMIEASRMLMFADMQTQKNYLGDNSTAVCAYFAGDGSASTDPNYNGNDGVLMEPTAAPSGAYSSPESIGFIHKMSGDYRGHAVFMDGQVAAIGLYYDAGGNRYSNAPTNCTYDACNGHY